MKKIIITIMFTLSFSIVAQDMRVNSFSSLFSDHKANRVGDAITIVVIESSQASNDARTAASRDSDIGGNFAGNAMGQPLPGGEMALGTTNNFDGRGSTTTSGSFKTKISATIDTVFSNGNMRISGRRKISINGEEQVISISGIVRVSDIQADNSVLSYNISDAQIILEGSGMIERVQSPGWVTKIFHWLF